MKIKIREMFSTPEILIAIAIIAILIAMAWGKINGDIVLDNGGFMGRVMIHSVVRIIKEGNQFKIVKRNGEIIYTGNATIRILNPDIVIEE